MQIISFVFPFSFPILLKSPAFPCPCSKYILLIFNCLMYLQVSEKVVYGLLYFIQYITYSIYLATVCQLIWHSKTLIKIN